MRLRASIMFSFEQLALPEKSVKRPFALVFVVTPLQYLFIYVFGSLKHCLKKSGQYIHCDWVYLMDKLWPKSQNTKRYVVDCTRFMYNLSLEQL